MVGPCPVHGYYSMLQAVTTHASACTLHCRLEEVYLKALDLGELMDRARQAVVGHARGSLKDDPEAELPVRICML